MEKTWENVKVYWSKTNRWHRVLLILLLVELRLVPTGQVGFWCNDPALSHTYTGDTITWKWLFGPSIFLPLPIMLLAERYCNDDKSKVKSRALAWYKEYLFGLLINVTLVQMLKLLVGAPRPHFFDTCQPEEALSCQASEYVSSYTCTKSVWSHESNKSFPSGHSAIAMYAGVFVAYFMNRRTERTRAALTVQTVSVFSAVYCCLSRLSDRRHHWWDVLAGATLAAPILLYTILYLCKNFECPENKLEKADQPTSANGQTKSVPSSPSNDTYVDS